WRIGLKTDWEHPIDYEERYLANRIDCENDWSAHLKSCRPKVQHPKPQNICKQPTKTPSTMWARQFNNLGRTVLSRHNIGGLRCYKSWNFTTENRNEHLEK